jgi:hypothetical protein
VSRRDDHVSADQGAVNAQFQARRRAIAECAGRLVPDATVADLFLSDDEQFAAPEVWDKLNVDYLRAEWPPSMLN